MKTLIILATLNTADSLLATINQLQVQVPDADILVIDRKSNDQTLDLLTKNKIEYLTTPLPTSYYDAISLGLMYALNYDYEAVVEFNDQHLFAIKDILYLLRIFEYKQVDLIFASRFAKYAQKPKDAKILRLIMRWKSKHKISDLTTSFKVYGPKAIKFFGTEMTLNKPTPDKIINLTKKNFTFWEAFIQTKQSDKKLNKHKKQKTFWKNFYWGFAILLFNPWRLKKPKLLKTKN